MQLKKINDYIYELPMEGEMLVPGRVYSSPKLLHTVDEKTLSQVKNVACLPGIQNYSYCMPDAHMGYGFPIGGVAAFDLQEGIISPGGIGFDIGCSMRLVSTNLTEKEVRPKVKELMDELFKVVPSGVGAKGLLKLNKQQLEAISEEGAKWCLDNGYAWEQDIERIEEKGKIKQADFSKVSQKAIDRGVNHLGTLGSGNHYLEVQLVTAAEIYDKEKAKAFGIHSDKQIVIMIHCGSRGFGHQIATDYLDVFLKAMPKYGLKVLDRELTCAPFQSEEAQNYYKAMACAANFAFANKQLINHHIRKSFEKIFGQTAESMEMNLVYDVAHNIAKIEKHKVNGKTKQVLVHRKGSTRSFPPGHEELTKPYKKHGQPVIIGGSMETGSHLLVGTEIAMKETFGSTAHGSGRVMSRTKAKNEINGQQLQKDMLARGIYVKTASFSGLAEEAGFAYKDISEVVEAIHNAGLSYKVVGLKPISNLKG
ncbi:MAG: RtcB family protein [archaeon]|nr:RtcB family protein [archaeon]